MNSVVASSKVAVVGAGIAGAACARRLAAAGFTVQVVDKGRGVGGRLATRRLQWLDAQGLQHTARLDHGAPAFAARDAAFRQYLAGAVQTGLVLPWWPTLAAGSRPLGDATPLYLPWPDMPSLCRGLLRDVPITSSFAVDRLWRDPCGWQLGAADLVLPGQFDAVVLALPPAQAAPLLAPHRSDWAQRASLALMQPCWTLLGVARRPTQDLRWDVGRPEQGPLSWVLRNDFKPGRGSSAGEAQWVVHARAGWSREHMEQPADWVQGRLQAALQNWLGEPIEWQHAVVHRWRYANLQPSGIALARRGWWDDRLGLGVCGEFLGGAGVEGAWLSGQALSASMLQGVGSALAEPLARPPQHAPV